MSEADGDILLERFEAVTCSRCRAVVDTSAAAPFSTVACANCGTAMKVPARFANFILVDQLGKGGMGAVYKAYDETLGRTVALKVMQQSIGRDRAFVDQFLQEARALAAINHPNIVQIYSYGEENGQPYIVMELVDGGRLDKVHKEHPVLDEVQVLTWALEIIGGLQAADAAGMTHGDIKPANILFDKRGSAKVSDFGLARLNGEKPKPGEIWGTPYYVAPEVVRGQAPSAGSDIYSLGGTLYHLLTGEPPFNGPTVTETVLERFRHAARGPQELNPRLSGKTAAILSRMLEVDPMRRYPTYESLAKDVAGALAEEEARRKGEGQKKGSAGAKVLWVLVTLLVLAGIGAGVWAGAKVHRKKAEERAAKEQLERDIAEGRVRKIFVNGAFRYVKVDLEAEAAKRAEKAAAKAAAADAGGAAQAPAAKHWDCVAAADADVSGGKPSDDPAMLLLRGGEGGAAVASKVYLRFDLGGVDAERVKKAELQLVVAKKGAVKKALAYELRVWAVKDAGEWSQLEWATAPGNAADSAGGMGEGAELVAEHRLPANPEAGDVLKVEDERLAAAVRACGGGSLTLVLTASENGDQKGGWRFAATEKQGSFRAATLVMDAE